MKHTLKLIAALAAAAAFASIAAAYAFATEAARGTTVMVARSRLGRILVDGKGITLYDFVRDKFGGPWWVLSPAGKEIHRG